MTTVTYTVPAQNKTQVCKLEDGRWFKTIEEIVAKDGSLIPAGTALYVVMTSTTKWWTVSDESGNTPEISKFEGVAPV